MVGQGRRTAFREGFLHALNALRQMKAGGFARPDEIGNVMSDYAAGELKAWSLGKGEAWNSQAPRVWAGGTWWDVRDQVLARDGNTCATCGSTEGLQIDHIHPVANGGGPYLGNLQVLCKACNLQKGTS